MQISQVGAFTVNDLQLQHICSHTAALHHRFGCQQPLPEPKNAALVSCSALLQGGEQAHGAHASADVPFHPSRSMPLDRRRRLGIMCKQLIDAGRLHFLERHGFPAARSVLYVDKDVTGENRMLIGVAHPKMNGVCKHQTGLS